MDRKWVFRGWDAVGQKGWVYGDLIHNQKVTETGLEPRVMVGGYEVVPESVGISIGIKDKESNSIYDGDIVYVKFVDGSHGNYLVGWNDDVAGFGFMDSYSYQSIREGYDYAIFNPWMLVNMRRESLIFKVIGNVFFNSKLLENHG